MSDAPLAGRRILVTRRAQPAAPLVARLSELGAEVVVVPAIELAAPEDPAALDSALGRMATYHWVIFTSGNAVRAVADRLEALGRSLDLRGPRIATVGSATSHAVSERFRGRSVDLQPAADFSADGLLSAFARFGWPEGQRCLLPLGDRARDSLAVGLTAHGALVDAVIAYRTVVPPGIAERIADAFKLRVDLALFASPSAVESFVAAAGERAHGLPAAVIGPVTQEAARGAGMMVLAVATPSTIDGLTAAAVRCLSTNA